MGRACLEGVWQALRGVPWVVVTVTGIVPEVNVHSSVKTLSSVNVCPLQKAGIFTIDIGGTERKSRGTEEIWGRPLVSYVSQLDL